MAIRKMCCRPGCDELALEGSARCAEHEAERVAKQKARAARAKLNDVAKAGAKLYALPAWKRLRRQWLEAHPLCSDCAGVGLVEAATDVDHITPHRGDRALFFDRNNLQSLCHSCHSRKTAREVLATGGRSKI
jgi:5-methylcytosine-specific restriction protein A